MTFGPLVVQLLVTMTVSTHSETELRLLITVAKIVFVQDIMRSCSTSDLIAITQDKIAAWVNTQFTNHFCSVLPNARPQSLLGC